MKARFIAMLALALTGGAVASASAARSDPPYDDDRVVSELARHEFHFSDETDITLPTVRCTPLDVRSAVPVPQDRSTVSVVLGRHHLGLEGREVMTLSDHPTSDLELRSAGSAILPLTAELEYERSVAKAAGAPLGRAELYLDESMPWSAARSVIGAIDLARGLVVRDAETSHLRVLQIHPYTGVFCVRSEFTGNLFIEDRRILDDDGRVLLTFDEHIGTEVFRTAATQSDWDMAVHVIGDPPLDIVAAVVAAFDHGGSGDPNDDVPIVDLDLRPSREIRMDRYATDRRCDRRSATAYDGPRDPH